jgi:serine/threonine protein phosphatase PrpC
VRGGSGEIGTVEEQPGQPVVRPPAQLVGEGAEPVTAGGRSGHPAYATRPPRPRTPYSSPHPGGGLNQVELQHGAATDIGLVREVNEDAFLAAPPVYVVADGMGGHEGGDVASAIVVEEFARLADEGYDPRRGAEVVAATLRICQDRIGEYGAAQRARGAARFHAGTTAVVALLVEDDEGPKWLLANLGDSRIYRFVDGVLEQVSVDHSVVQELVESGTITPAAAATHPERHVITRALGGPDSVEADYFLLPLPSVERLVLCSDGVTGMIDDPRIAAILASAEDPRDAADQMVAAAVGAGGRDNATAIVVDVVGLVTENSYDSERQRVSLEQKLGALP